MKKNLRYFMTLLLMMVASVGWAEDVTSTLTFTAACNGSGKADDGVAWTVTSDADESNFDSTRGIHYGTSKADVSYLNLTTSGITGTISKIVVNASGASKTTATVNVTVGGNAFGGDAQPIASSAADYTFTGSASGEIVVNVSQDKTNKALYVKSIAVTYTTGGTHTCATPTFSPAAGTYSSAQNVTINTDTEGATIYYTIDGSTPTTSSDVYLSAINVSETTTIKAMAVKADMDNSSVASATYTIKTPASEPKEGDYVKVTSTDAITDGVYLIVYEEGGLAFNGGLTTLDATKNTISVTITNNTIAGSETVDAAAFTINANAGSGSIKSTSGYYIGRTTNSNGLDSSQTGVYTNSFEISNGNAIITSSSNPTLQYNNTSGQERFRYFKSTNQQPIALYKKVVAEDTREDANFSFPQASYAIEQGDEFIAPTLSKADGYDGMITYTISGDDIATIDSETGELTLNGSAGSALITATGTGSTTFKDDEASYSLTVAAVCQNIAEFKALTDGTTSKLKLTNAQVQHINGKDMYVADETGGIDFYDIGENYAAGMLLNGYITAKYTVYKGTKELTNPTEKNIVATDGTVNATPLEGESVSLDANEYTLVQVKGELTKTDNNYFIDGLQVYNKFKISEIDLGSLTEGKYIATGIVVPYNNNAELALTAIKEVVTFTIAEACTDGKGNYFGTFYTDKPYVMPEGVTGQTVAVDANSKLVVNDAYDAGSVVPAKTPLLMKATAAGEKTAEVTTEEGSAATNNMLKGTLTADELTTDGDKYYRLTMHNGTTLGFYYGAADGAAFTPGANKAYLAVPATAAKEGFAFGETTGINNVNVNENENGKIFNLAGQQMKSAVKGVYIKNGRKYVK